MPKFCSMGEPFFDQPTKYHCPIFCCLSFNKNTQSCFHLKIWKYFSGDFSNLKNIVSSFDWSSVFDADISKYADNFINQLLSFCDETIPSNIVAIRSSNSPWFHKVIMKHYVDAEVPTTNPRHLILKNTGKHTTIYATKITVLSNLRNNNTMKNLTCKP